MEQIISRFADVQLIQLAAVLPLCWMLTRSVIGRWQIPLGGLALLLSALAWWEHAIWHDHQSQVSLWPTVLHQMLVILPLAAGSLLWGHRLARFISPKLRSANRFSPLAWSLAVAVALVPPAVYRVSRIQAAAAHLQELQSQSRVGETVELGQSLLEMAPAMEYRNESFRDVLSRWERRQQQFIDELPRIADRLQQARLLAMLGLRHEALMLLDIEASPEHRSVEACLLAGTIYEHEHDWSQSLYWYERARAKLNLEDAASLPALASACRGIAWCHRKQGRFREAEAAYLQMLELRPDAESHWLLARFYEDAQAGQRAAHHLDAAIAAGGPKYAALAREMRSQLQSRSFGCLQVWRTQGVGVGVATRGSR
ncbi:Tetratricopeptide repeat protein [Maioricimonas rarisocia]|uniref:Tetratricopeptide repeat protein n=1 Tax=Maioricimonas rarisocia TaxID=2528026 RepID=A0A517ZAK8_9PLAN|nr:tetratricopeptide repeat protein [Maioricimonas rarisocia]QDU39535.1 Tetratricopeptide repeat protein [Maioricimonas rarisocia]